MTELEITALNHVRKLLNDPDRFKVKNDVSTVMDRLEISILHKNLILNSLVDSIYTHYNKSTAEAEKWLISILDNK